MEPRKTSVDRDGRDQRVEPLFGQTKRTDTPKKVRIRIPYFLDKEFHKNLVRTFQTDNYFLKTLQSKDGTNLTDGIECPGKVTLTSKEKIF